MTNLHKDKLLIEKNGYKNEYKKNWDDEYGHHKISKVILSRNEDIS